MDLQDRKFIRSLLSRRQLALSGTDSGCATNKAVPPVNHKPIMCDSVRNCSGEHLARPTNTLTFMLFGMFVSNLVLMTNDDLFSHKLTTIQVPSNSMHLKNRQVYFAAFLVARCSLVLISCLSSGLAGWFRQAGNDS